VLTGLPRVLFPCGFHSATCLTVLQSAIPMVWPCQFNCSSISCNVTAFIPIFVSVVPFIRPCPGPFVIFRSKLIFYGELLSQRQTLHLEDHPLSIY
jgi:hypothetical protein